MDAAHADGVGLQHPELPAPVGVRSHPREVLRDHVPEAARLGDPDTVVADCRFELSDKAAMTDAMSHIAPEPPDYTPLHEYVAKQAAEAGGAEAAPEQAAQGAAKPADDNVVDAEVKEVKKG